MENAIELKLFFWIGTAIMLLSILSIVLIITVYRSHVHKIHREEADNLLKISLSSEKQERQRIASDLHDGISGDLSAVQNYITILHSKEQDPFNKIIFREIETALGNLLENVQDISNNLIPSSLESLGLVSTLRSYFERIRKWNNVRIHDHYDAEHLPLALSDAYELYRIIQELIANMMKHGKSDEITCFVCCREKSVVFEICDNGSAFDFYKSVKNSEGKGLKNITSRIKYTGAKLIQLPAEKGNTIHIYIPTQ